jgi:hypothetical protein
MTDVLFDIYTKEMHLTVFRVSLGRIQGSQKGSAKKNQEEEVDYFQDIFVAGKSRDEVEQAVKSRNPLALVYDLSSSDKPEEGCIISAGAFERGEQNRKKAVRNTDD